MKRMFSCIAAGFFIGVSATALANTFNDEIEKDKIVGVELNGLGCRQIMMSFECAVEAKYSLESGRNFSIEYRDYVFSNKEEDLSSSIKNLSDSALNLDRQHLAIR
ncbi:MAG: hypothetical protein ACEPO2_05515 [Pelagibaca sp.]